MPEILTLDRAFADQHIDELVALTLEIPKVTTSAEDILANQKPDGRVLRAKWLHSFALVDDDAVVGLILAYERAAEANDIYQLDSLYINDLAVRSDYQQQGLGRRLLLTVLRQGLEQGFHELTGPMCFTLQTNSADWNAPVRGFYEKLGFHVTGHKEYPDEARSDVVMYASADNVASVLAGANEE